MAVQWEKEMMDLLGEGGFVLDPATKSKLSKDYYWYSPVLDEKLKDKLAEGVVIPVNEEEVVAILSCAYRHLIPVTVRGGGTGNYGQAVPLTGGVVMALHKMNRILEIGDGFARVQCGVKLGVLEKELRAAGHELCIYPSTYMKATVGGFVSGGSGGIGSISWGNLWDGNVLEAVVYTMEEHPRKLKVAGEELLNYIHSYGTTGIVTELTLRTSKRTEWVQSLVQFDDLTSAMLFSEKLCQDPGIRKRLVSTVEWPIPSYFLPFAQHVEEGSAAVLLETEEGTLPSVTAYAEASGGQIKHVIPADNYHQTLGLSDFTWNHTTLWAIKADPKLTYLQCAFSPTFYLKQIEDIKRQYPDGVYLHFEWVLSGGKLMPAALPVVRYQSEEHLYEMIAFFESLGVRINDPHTFVLNYGSRGAYERMLSAKQANDPRVLLNPGKMNVKPIFGE
ncbi:FAD-binding oxidoreductase [Paenibacillus sp. 1P07SE]|uniref:FAD-binding oxidoreductase n=1 Tax=Paenibacillus sp. 1P07SE TaxID=3132209 RepID=UPI0039A56E36